MLRETFKASSSTFRHPLHHRRVLQALLSQEAQQSLVTAHLVLLSDISSSLNLMVRFPQRWLQGFSLPLNNCVDVKDVAASSGFYDGWTC